MKELIILQYSLITDVKARKTEVNSIEFPLSYILASVYKDRKLQNKMKEIKYKRQVNFISAFKNSSTEIFTRKI